MSMLDTWAPSLTERIAAHALYLGAIQRCCDIQLAWFIACNEAAPPSIIVRSQTDDTPKQGWRQVLAPILAILTVLAVCGLFIYAICTKLIVIPTLALDILFGSCMLFLWSILFASALYRVFPRPLAVHKSRLGEEDRWICDFTPTCSTEGYLNWLNPRVNHVAGSACTVGLTYAILFGYKSAMPISLAAGVLANTLRTNPIGATAKLRHSVFSVLLPYAGFVLVMIQSTLFPNNRSEKHASSRTDPPMIISKWLMPFLFLWITVIVASMPGQMFMINMRYEHSRIAPNAITPNSKQVSPVVIGQHEKILPLHLLCLGMSGLLFAVLDFADLSGYIESAWTFYISFFFVAPVIVATSAIWTCLRGDFWAWYRYEETWYPKIDPAVTTEVGQDHGSDFPEEKKDLA